jgi:hypothetical protein
MSACLKHHQAITGSKNPEIQKQSRKEPNKQDQKQEALNIGLGRRQKK